jgi:hypothetical protein
MSYITILFYISLTMLIIVNQWVDTRIVDYYTLVMQFVLCYIIHYAIIYLYYIGFIMVILAICYLWR